MTPIAAAICVAIIDEAGALGVELTRAAELKTLPAEAVIHLRDALAAVRRAAEALTRTETTATR